MSHFCPIFAAGMKNSPVGNLLTRLNDTVFIFEAKKQSKMCEISGSYIIDAKVVDGRAWFLR